VVWANRLMHPEADVPKQRVRGPALFLDVFELGQEVGLKHYLLGSTPRGARVVWWPNLEQSYPGAKIVGSESPPFRDLTDDEREAQRVRIVESGAEIVWVGLGTPKQDVECARMAVETRKVFVAVGAAFDFAAGVKTEARRGCRTTGSSGCTGCRRSRDGCGSATCSATSASSAPPSGVVGHEGPGSPQPLPVRSPLRRETWWWRLTSTCSDPPVSTSSR